MRQTPPGLRCGSISNTGRLGSPFSRSSADSVSITTPNRIQQRSLQAPVSTSDIAEKAAMPALLKTCLAQDLPCSRLALLKTCPSAVRHHLHPGLNLGPPRGLKPEQGSPSGAT